MATRFAIANGNWSNTAIWDNGALPLPGDVVYANGFTVTLDTNATVDQLRNDGSPVYVPDIATPIMTSDNTPSGTVFYSSQQGGQAAYNAFRQDGNTTFWGSTSQAGSLGYQFSTGKVIKRYVLTTGFNINNNPRTWTFEGSNDGTTWTVLDTQTAVTFTGNTIFTGTLLANTTSYTYYRINVTITATGQPASVGEFQMTESTGVVLGGAVGGTFSLANGVDFICTNTPALITATTTGVLTFSLNAPNSATFRGSVLSHNLFSNAVLISQTGTGTLNLIGDYSPTGGTTNSVSAPNFILNNGGVLNITGNLNNSVSVTGSGSCNTVTLLGGGSLIVNGNLSQSALGNPNGVAYIILATSFTSITINGNITSAGNFNTLFVPSAGIVNINGNITGNVVAAVNVTGAATLTINGDVTASTTSPALTSTSTGVVTVNGNLINASNGSMAVYASRIAISNAATQTWFMYRSGAVASDLLTSDQIVPGGTPPATTDVRSGVVYNITSTGTLAMPSPSSVAYGVPVDNTTGTAVIVASDFPNLVWNRDKSLLLTAGSIGLRLKDVASVDSTGYQIAAFKP